MGFQLSFLFCKNFEVDTWTQFSFFLCSRVSSVEPTIVNMGQCLSNTEGSEEGVTTASSFDLSPNTPIEAVFGRVCASCGIKDASSTTKYVAALKSSWYFRAYDMIKIEEETWNTLTLPIIFKKQLFKLLDSCRNNESFLCFQENADEAAKEKDISSILEALLAENGSVETSKHIEILKEALDAMYCLNRDKFKKYMEERTWNEIVVPQYLKVLLLQRIGHKLEREGDGALFPEQGEVLRDFQNATDRGLDEESENVLDPSSTMTQICSILGEQLYAETARIREHLSPLLALHHRRLYHLARIRDELFIELLSAVPQCLKDELFDIMSTTRGRSTDALPFYHYPEQKRRKSTMNRMKLKRIEMDWTIKTEEAMLILERDMNMEPGTLTPDCNLLMEAFYSIPEEGWNSLPNYKRFDIVRVRIKDLMDECAQKYHLNMDDDDCRPRLPEEWLNKYDPESSIEQLFRGGNKKQFTLDGLHWSKETARSIRVIEEYLNQNYVGKLMFIAEEHAQKNKAWTQYLEENAVPSHIRFKINYFSSRGCLQSDDDWLNAYISRNYPKSPPQYQSLLDRFQISDITHNSATVCFCCFIDWLMAMILIGSLQIEFDELAENGYLVEIMDDDQKEQRWQQASGRQNGRSYILRGLNPDSMYKVRARCNDDGAFGFCPFSKTKSFRTLQFVMTFKRIKSEHRRNGLLFGRGDTVKYAMSSEFAWSSCIFGDEINHEMCRVFDLELEWKTASGEYAQFVMG